MRRRSFIGGVIVVLLFVVATVLFITHANKQTSPSRAPELAEVVNREPSEPGLPSAPTLAPSTPTKVLLASPLGRARERITKKPFGLYVSPKDSPVQPEKFTGYHTGVDFETFSDEQKSDVSVSAVCTGPIVLKKRATGYGGVAVQRCTLDTAEITVVYGHLRLASIAVAMGSILKAGDIIGVLGTGYTQETDGERKHLHLGIHKGTGVNILGYVSKKSDVQNWLDVSLYLP